MRYIIFIVVLTVSLFITAGDIAYVNIDKVFSDYKGINDINIQIEKELKEWKAQMTDMEKEIARLEKVYEEEAPMLSEEAKIRKRDEINKMRKQLDNFIEEIWGEDGKADNINKQLLKPVADKIDAVIEEMALENKFSAVFDLSDGNILYIDPENDITQDIIDELNKEFFIPVKGIEQYVVYDFIAEDKEARNEQYHIKLASVLYTNLNTQNELEPVDIREVNSILQNRGITNIEDLTVADAINIAIELSAEYAITGSVSVSGSRIIMTVSVYDINKRNLLKEISKEASGGLDFENVSAEILTEVKTILKSE